MWFCLLEWWDNRLVGKLLFRKGSAISTVMNLLTSTYCYWLRQSQNFRWMICSWIDYLTTRSSYSLFLLMWLPITQSQTKRWIQNCYPSRWSDCFSWSSSNMLTQSRSLCFRIHSLIWLCCRLLKSLKMSGRSCCFWINSCLFTHPSSQEKGCFELG